MNVCSGGARILGGGSRLYVGDVVTTGPRSVALLKLGDGSRITLRPDTSFQVEEYNLSATSPSAVFVVCSMLPATMPVSSSSS